MAKHGATRRNILTFAGAGAAAAVLGETAFSEAAYADTDDPTAPAVTAAEEIDWYDVREWGVEGKGWQDTALFYDRFPARAEATVRPAVWNLSRQSAGMSTRFVTDSTSFHVRYTLRSASLAMSHMPATGVSGVDLYAHDDDGRDRWLAVARPAAQTVQAQLVAGVDPGTRLYTVYLPLYNGVNSLEIGVAAGATFRPVAPRTAKPLVFYGTSIMQGACASRPGMAMTALLGRRFGLPTINLGFSGNGQMEAAVGDLLTELDAAVHIVDCLPNMTADMVAARTEPLVRQLRAAHPDTPILLVEDRTYGYATFVKSARDRHAASRAALHAAYDRLRDDGVRGLSYLGADRLLGTDGEATTDGSHPNDLGMTRYADAYESVLKRLVRRH